MRKTGLRACVILLAALAVPPLAQPLEREPLPVFAERSIRGLEEIYINGGRRGLLLRIRACDLEAAVELKWVDVALS